MKRLGKGLDSLLADSSMDDSSGQQVVDLLIRDVAPNPGQPRKDFDEVSLQELSDSIKEVGIIQPIIVQEIKDSMPGAARYQIIAGERRYRASIKAGLTTIPGIVRAYGFEQSLEVALIENLQREDLNPLEEALAFKDLMDRFELGQEEVAKKIGKNRSTVANSLRLLKLPPEAQLALRNGALSAGHARCILAVGAEQQAHVFAAIIEKELSVRDAEALAKAINSGMPVDGAGTQGSTQDVLAMSKGATLAPNSKEHKPDSERREVELWEMEEKLIVALGTKVNIKGNTRNGKIEISYFSLEDLERLYDLFSGKRTAS